MATIKLLYQLTVRDKNGKIIRRTRKKLSHSFVKQFMDLIEACSNITPQETDVKDINDAAKNAQAHANNLNLDAAVGSANSGIVVGTGTGVEDNADVALGTLIAHGAGAGQLNYGAQSKTTTAITGGNVDFILTRTFGNTSGGAITVEEVGIYSEGFSTPFYFCIVRDLTGGVAVANGQTLTVDYTFRTTV